MPQESKVGQAIKGYFKNKKETVRNN